MITKSYARLYLLILMPWVILIKDLLYQLTGNDAWITNLGRVVSAISLVLIFLYLPSISFKFKRNQKFIFFFSLFCVSMNLITLIFHRSMSDTISIYFFFLLILISMCSTDEWDFNEYINLLEKPLFVYLFLSIVIMFFGYGLELDYEGFLANFPYRLNGLATHANTLGFISSIYVLIYFRTKKIKSVFAGIVCLLSQSKTALIGLLVCLVFYFVYKNYKNKKSFIIFFVIFLALIMALIFVDNLFVNFDFTFTGRTALWNKGFNEWKKSFESICFGAGEDVLISGSNTITRQLHNQFLNTLFGTGIVGLIFLLQFIIKIIIESIQSLRIDVLPFLLSLAFLIRSMSETPFFGMGLNMIGFAILTLFLCLKNVSDKETVIE